MTTTISLPDTDDEVRSHFLLSFSISMSGCALPSCPPACSHIALIPCCSIQPTKPAEYFIHCWFSEQHCVSGLDEQWDLPKGSSRSQQGRIIILPAASYFVGLVTSRSTMDHGLSRGAYRLGLAEGSGSMILNERFVHYWIIYISQYDRITRKLVKARTRKFLSIATKASTHPNHTMKIMCFKTTDNERSTAT